MMLAASRGWLCASGYFVFFARSSRSGRGSKRQPHTEQRCDAETSGAADGEPHADQADERQVKSTNAQPSPALRPS